MTRTYASNRKRPSLSVLFPSVIIIAFLFISSFSGAIPTGRPVPEPHDSLSLSDNIHIPSDNPGHFTGNRGQFGNEEIQFVHSGGGAAFLESAVVFLVRDEDSCSVIRISFDNSNPVIPVPVGEPLHRSDYFHGSDPSGWHTGVPNYGSIIYRDLYDGIDLVFYTTVKGLKYDFLISPESYRDSSNHTNRAAALTTSSKASGCSTMAATAAAAPGAIRMVYGGIDGLEIDDDGNIHITTASGDLMEKAPFSYQEQHGATVDIPSRFRIEGNTISFELGNYDHSLPLVIDPLVFSSYLGGSESDNALGLVLDDSGDIYLTGDTYSGDFPVSDGAYQETKSGDRDIFVFKLGNDGSEMLHSTFIGGSGQDVAHGVFLDGNGDIYVAGRSDSTDFPTTAGAYDETHNGENDVVVLKLNGQCSDLIYSTYVGGGRYEVGYAGLAVDETGSAYVAGHTNSADFPTTEGAYDRSYYAAGWDGFAFKLEPDGSDLVYSTYFGGWDYEGARSIFVDGEGNSYMTGDTTSDDFPTTAGAYDETHNGERDGFLLAFNPDGSDLVFSTFLGGGDNDIPEAMVPGDGDTIWVTGESYSTDFPTTAGAYSETNSGERDFFVSRMSDDGAELRYSTFVGGGDTDEAWALSADGDVIHVGGRSRSGDFPVTDTAVASENGGSIDAIMLTLDTGKTGEEQLMYSTYLGGEQNEAVWDMEFLDGDLYVAGLSSSEDFPVTDGAYSTEYNGGFVDAVVFRLRPDSSNIPPTVMIDSPAGNSVVSGNVTIEGSAEDEDGTVGTVEVSVDSEDWIEAEGTDSWEYEWNTWENEDGIHDIRVRAFDGTVYSVMTNITLIVDNTNGTGGNGDDDDDDDFEIAGMDGMAFMGITAIVVLLAAAVGAVLLRLRGRKGEDRNDGKDETRWGSADAPGEGEGEGAGTTDGGAGVCPDCGNESDWIEDYESYYCWTCESYLRDDT